MSLTCEETSAAAKPGASALLTVSPDQFLNTCHADMETARTGMAKLKAMPAPRDPMTALETFDSASWVLGNAIARSGLAHEVHPSPEFRAAAEKCEQDAVDLATEFSLDRGIYNVLNSLDVSHAAPATQYLLTKTLRDFRLAGVDKDDATRARIKQLNDELVKTGQEFAKNIRDDVRHLELDPAELDGLPADFIRAHTPNAAGKIMVTTDNPDYIPVMSYAKSSKVREELWRLYLQRGHPKNLAVLSAMLQKRYELAQLIGYKDWADYIMQDKMIGNEKNAANFIAKITALSGAREQKDYAQLLALKKKEDPAAKDVTPWDSQYLQEKLKREEYGFDSQAVRPFFEFSRVKQGVFDITSRMYGIRYQHVPDAPVWHPDVEAYDVYSGDKLLGRIYLDMFPRENKYKHYAQFTLVSGKEGVALPEGVLVCNFPRPASEPGLMEYRDVRTFFHEFGHLLHHTFGGHIRWGYLSGTSVQQDFVEAPSQMFEEWVRDPETLQIFARDYKTDQPIPAELVHKLRQSDEVAKGLQVRQQMFYAAVSLNFYNRNPQGLDTTKMVADLQGRYTPFHYVDGTYFHESFGHLDGYSAVYYTYMWSLVIAKDMFTPFEQNGLLSPEVAARYRKDVLEPGGSKPAAELVSDFLGRPYNFQAYERWLNSTE